MALLNATLIGEDAAPLLAKAFLDALVVECTAHIRLADAPVWLHWLNPRPDALVVPEVVVFAAAAGTLMADLIHCTYVFLVDAPLGKTVTGGLRRAQPAQRTLSPPLVRVARPFMAYFA